MFMFAKTIFGRLAMLLGLISLGGCGKTVSFIEELEVDGKKIEVKRTVSYEQQPVQLEWRYQRIGAELQFPGLGLPSWQTKKLSPMYLGKNASGEFVLVTLIRDEGTWVDRGKPALWYVAYKVQGGKWVETTVPPEFAGRKANFVIGIRVETGEKPVVTIREREFRNQVSAPGREGTILLTNLTTSKEK